MNSQELLELISAKNYKGIVLIDDITLFNIPAVNDYHCYLIKVDELVYYSVYIFYDNAYLYNLAHKSVAVPEIISGFLSISFNVFIVESDSIKDLELLLAGQIYLMDMFEYVCNEKPKQIIDRLFDGCWKNTLLVLRDFFIIRKPCLSACFKQFMK